MLILVADDHPLFRMSLVGLVSRLDPNVIVDEADSFDSVLQRLGTGNDYDLMLLDLRMPGGNPIDTLHYLHRSHPHTPIVVVSAADHRWDVQHALGPGAVGFISKSVPEGRLRESLTRILAGEFPQQIGDTFVAAAPAVRRGATTVDGQGMTARQREVLTLLCAGQSNKEIARTLGVSVGTVKLHVCAVLEALDVDNRTQAVLKARSLNLDTIGGPSSH